MEAKLIYRRQRGLIHYLLNGDYLEDNTNAQNVLSVI